MNLPGACSLPGATGTGRFQGEPGSGFVGPCTAWCYGSCLGPWVPPSMSQGFHLGLLELSDDWVQWGPRFLGACRESCLGSCWIRGWCLGPLDQAGTGVSWFLDSWEPARESQSRLGPLDPAGTWMKWACQDPGLRGVTCSLKLASTGREEALG